MYGKSHKGQRAKGCGLCTPWKSVGNSTSRRSHRDLVKIEAAKAAIAEAMI